MTSNSAASEPLNADQFLATARTTLISRSAERGTKNERLMTDITHLFNQRTGHSLTEAEGWLFMVCLKLVRITGGADGRQMLNRYKSDDFVDLASYAALLGESLEESIAQTYPNACPGA